MNIEKIQDLAIKFRDAADSAFEYGAFGQGYPFVGETTFSNTLC